jgi:hypothetical protein
MARTRREIELLGRVATLDKTLRDILKAIDEIPARRAEGLDELAALAQTIGACEGLARRALEATEDANKTQ